MKALIDADIFTYSFGSCKNDEGYPLAWPLVATRLNAQIKNINERVEATEYQLYITGKGNFREKIATIRPYKGSRPSEKPFWYEQVRRYLVNFRNAKVVEGWEADDQLAMEQLKDYEKEKGRYFSYIEDDPVEEHILGPWEESQEWQLKTIICSVDKDLDMIPGLHYNWLKDEIYTITEIEGLRNFYSQLLTGDSVDNIPGLFGVGKSSKMVKNIQDCTSEWCMFNSVLEQYQKRFGSYAWQFMVENAQLLWMVRDEKCEQKELEIVQRLEKLKSLDSGQIWKEKFLNNLKIIT